MALRNYWLCRLWFLFGIQAERRQLVFECPWQHGYNGQQLTTKPMGEQRLLQTF